MPQHSAQLVKVHRLGKVEIESGLLSSLDILGSAKTGERYCFDRTFSLGLRDDIVAVTIWQSDVAQDCIELFRVNDAQRFLRAIGHRNFMAKMAEKTRQRFQSVVVIFNHQDAQTLARIRSLRPFLAHAPQIPREAYSLILRRVKMEFAEAIQPLQLEKGAQSVQECRAVLALL